MAEVARCCGKTEVIDSMNRQDLSLGPVEMTGAFTKRKEKRVNANTYQEGWIEWKTKSNGRRACRFRYWELEAQRLAQSGRAVERRPDDEASEKRVAGVYSWYRGDASSNSGYPKGEGSKL
jgi:hypothetical protein